MEWLTIVLSALAGLIVFYYYYLRGLTLFRSYGVPHIPPTAIVGNMGPLVSMKMTMGDLISKVYDTRPDAKYVGFYEFHTPVIIVRDLDLVKSITIRNSDHFQDHRRFINTDVDTLVGRSLFFMNGEAWKNHRSVVSPVFTSSKMKMMFKLMAVCAERYADYLFKLPEEEREMEMKTTTSKYVTDTIASCMFGVDVDTTKDPDNEYYANGKKIVFFGTIVQFFKLIFIRNLPTLAKLLRVRFMSKKLSKFFENLIQDNIKTREEKGIYRPDMLQLMIDKKMETKITDEYIISNAFGFFFGSFDTISSQVSYVFHVLAEQPEIQVKVQAEIDQVLEKNNGQFTYEAMTEMEYLDAVINETMRLYSIGVFMDRLCTKSFELPPAVPGAKPFTLKPGMNVWIPIWAIHRDPNYYEEPESFKPERFLTDGKKIMNSGAYLPFGMGPRMCIGNRFAMIQMKVLLCHILSRCDLRFGSKSQVPLKIAKGSMITPLPEHGFWIKIEPRKNVSPSLNGVKADVVL